ncbi:hypothetical protein CQW23_00305 [Capsicum baccatum]|uniref:Uncharacterized protein n=1 Tax=Capsicum baccatum TaxID=33114 RepID=A0A2G2XKC0_CAPBA|nr:hypothetical protein CQW23_00305 [Capsicum baccatum]
MVQGSRQWHEKLSFALLGYRTNVCTSTGATPYLLVYGTKAVIPVEVEIPSLRVIMEAEIDDDDWVKTRLEQLSLIEEKKQTSVEAKGKFSPNWQGPFILKKELPNGALYLTDIEGKMAEMAINADTGNAPKYLYIFIHRGMPRRTMLEKADREQGPRHRVKHRSVVRISVDMADPFSDIAILRDTVREIQRQVNDLQRELVTVRETMIREMQRLMRALLLRVDCPAIINDDDDDDNN